MTTEEITQNNITIAVFMDGQFKDSELDRFVFKIGDRWRVIRISKLRYNISWDWLLPVYKKLSDKLNEAKDVINKSDNPDKLSLLKHIDDCDCVIRCHIWGVRIEDVFYGIAETIKLYNEKFSKYEQEANTTN